MEVILSQDIDKIGKAGAVVKVKDGFARNYLFPRGLAVVKSAANVQKIEQAKQKRAAVEEKSRKEAEALQAKLSGLSLTIAVLTQEQDALYGSVTAQELARALADEGISIDKSSIELEEPIKALGIYEVPIRLNAGLSAKLKVWIVKK